MSQQQRLVRNTVFAAFGIAGAGLVRFLFALVTGREFGPTELGLVAVIISVATIVTIPAAGIGAAGNRYLAVATGAGRQNRRNQVLAATWTAGVLAVVVGGVGMWAWYTFLDTSAGMDATLILLGASFVMSYGVYLVAKAAMFGDGLAQRYAIGEIAGIVLFAITLSVVIVADLGVEWTLLSQIGWTVGVIVAATRAKVGPRIGIRGFESQGFWPFATNATLGSILSLGVTQATVVVMAAVHGNTAAGLLAVAIALTAPLYLLPRALSLALTPSMSFSVGAGDARRADSEARFTTTVMATAGAATVAVVILLTPALLAVYGPSFEDARALVNLYAVAAALVVAAIPTVNRFQSEGNRPLAFTVAASGVGLIAAIVVWLAAGSNGIIWIGIGYLASVAIKSLLPMLAARRIVGAWTVDGAWPVVLAIITVGAAFLPSPWNVVVVALLLVVVLATLAAAGIRYRSAIFAGRTDRPFTVGVITNAYPLPGHPYFGVFVRGRVDAYESLGCRVALVAPRRRSGVLKYLMLAADTVRLLLTGPIPDVFECHPTQPTGMLGAFAARIAQRPLVLYAHGADTRLPLRFPLEQLTRRSIASAAEIHTNSAATAASLRERWPGAGDVAILPPGISVPETAPPPASARSTDIVYVGNLIDRKGVDVLLQAVATLPPSTTVRIAGDGEDAQRLRTMASKLPHDIEFIGPIEPSEVVPLMATARVVAVPSRLEPFGQVAAEALSSGTPVVVTRTGGLAEIPDERCGMVVPPDDPTSLASALATILTLDDAAWTEYSDAARQRSTSFSVHHLAEQTIDRYRRIADTTVGFERVR